MMTSPLAAKTEPIHLLWLENIPIFQQLQWEEALLRADTRNWCILNMGSPQAIVMGISGQPEKLIDLEFFQQRPIPIIKRFSGGGTVLVDNHTFFVSWICNSSHSNTSCCPQKIHQVIEQFYQKTFPSLSMQLLENDYVIGNRKFGGNAQYLCKERWLHHSSFLWDFESHNMQYLKMPPKMPNYRQKRPHTDFLCRLSEYMPDKEALKNALLESLQQNFLVKKIDLQDVLYIAQKDHRKATQLIDI